MRWALLLLVVGVALGGATPARAGMWLVPPVDAAVTRPFDAPEAQWGAGHRGIDFAAPPGARVRAAAPGTVTFAGSVAGALAVTIDHGEGLETTYTRLADHSVHAGEMVDAGTWIGTVGEAHPGIPGLHFGVKLNGDYVDPATMLGPLDVSAAIHLVPAIGPPPEWMPTAFRGIYENAGSHSRPCEAAGLRAAPSPPSRNVADAIAGIGSGTRGAPDVAIYEQGPEWIGYPPQRVYDFSYRGTDGPRLHEPYDRGDTYGDIRAAAGRLRALLNGIARRHPHAHVDLIAHSQGGIVARTFLQQIAASWDPALPVIDHVVTFASPHGGTPLAGAVGDLRNRRAGAALLAGASLWSRRGGPVPDPLSVAVSQMQPGSELLRSLAREDVLFGTRALALAIPNDVIVPADRARWAGHASTVVPPAGLNGHEAIVTSDAARAITRAFLRDGPPACLGPWDSWGPRLGRAIGWTERLLGRAIP